MRTFDERLAEINRRSETIKKQRKQRKKVVLAICVPLLLCVSLSMTFLPQAETKPYASAPEAMQDVTMPAMLFQYLCSVSRIDVADQGVSLSITDPAEITKITDHLLQCGVDPVKTHPAAGSISGGYQAGSATRGEGIPGSMLDSVSCGYTITLTVPEETSVRYSLLDNTLTNLASGELYTLTQSQARELYHLLGLPQP